MVKQSLFQSDTDTLLRFSEHLNQLVKGESIGFSSTAESSLQQPNQSVLVTPYLPQGTEADDPLVDDTGTCLNLETLKCFEVVEYQYEEEGAIFSNCIAIQPSNPAFPTYLGSVVLMGAPKGGFLEVAFVNPVNAVNARVTSSQRLLMSAYNREQKIVAQAVLPVGNLANSDSVLPPNTLLSVKADSIHSVTFCAFDGQFTLSNFSICS
jgi:hypothetical protein